MTQAFKLQLAPPNTLARRFQYALLSFDDPLNPSYQLDLEKGVAVFNSYNDYVRLVKDAVGQIAMITTPADEGNCIPTNVLDIDCCMLDPGPSLCKQGKKHDRDYLEQAGLTTCMYTTRKGKRTIAWNHSAVSYADIVINNKSRPSQKQFKLPFLSKLTLYSSTRGSTSFDDTIDFDGLGSVLLGGALTHVGRERQMKERKRVNVDFHLLPESPSPAFKHLRSLMLYKPIAGRSVIRISWELSQDLNIGLDIATSIAVAAALNESKTIDKMHYIDPDFLVSSALLATVTIVVSVEGECYRPDMRSVIPLSTLIYKTYSPQTIESLLKLAYMVRRGDAKKKGRGRKSGEKKESNVTEAIAKAVPECVHSMFLQALGGKTSNHIYQCIRDLTSQLLQDKEVDRQGQMVLNQARMLVYNLRRDLVETIRG